LDEDRHDNRLATEIAFARLMQVYNDWAEHDRSGQIRLTFKLDRGRLVDAKVWCDEDLPIRSARIANAKSPG